MCTTSSSAAALPPDYTLLRRLAAEIVQKGRTRKKGPLARELRALTGLGHEEASGVSYTPSDRELLRLYFREHFADDLSLPLNTRVEAAGLVPDEKQGTAGVFAGLLNCGGVVPVHGRPPIPLGKGMILSLAPGLFDPAACRRLLVVENGALLVSWDKLLPLLPPEFAEATIIFRGAGPNVRTVEELLPRLPQDTAVAYYFDYDPAGLLMAAHYLKVRQGALVLPAKIDADVRRLNKSASFSAQLEQLNALKKRAAEDVRLKSALEEISTLEVALTQENLLAHGIALKLLWPQDGGEK